MRSVKARELARLRVLRDLIFASLPKRDQDRIGGERVLPQQGTLF